MREPDFNRLASRLLQSGITSRHTHRAINELRDHYDDLVDHAVDEGSSSKEARRKAAVRLGNSDDLVEAMTAQRELKTWAYRHPRVALLVYPVACLAALPALPVFAGVAHRVTIVKWGASLLAAGFVTASLLLIMQLSILFG